MPAQFTPASMKFLLGLARNNDRTWFEARRTVYEQQIKEPFHALIAQVSGKMADFAPEYIRPPHKIAMRIFRDTRFSPDKRPYKTHLAAWWACAGLEKRSAAGFFLQIGPAGGFIGAGIYAPEREDLLLVRRWLADHHERYRAMLAPLLRGASAMTPLDANALTRNPKGFAPDHPAGDLLRARNWGVTAALDAEAALQPTFGALVAKRFRKVAPLVALLNEPFLSVAKRSGSEFLV